jgi:hypothetical protein
MRPRVPNLFSQLKTMLGSAGQIIAHEENPPAHPPSPESLREGIEIKDANIFALGLAALGILIAGIVIQSVLGFSFSYFKHQHMKMDQSSQTPPADFLEADQPTKKLTEYRTRMARTLKTYGWVDREKKIVRIPIEKAMEDLVKGRGNGKK